MDTISYSAARNRQKEDFKVIIALDDFMAFKETACLLHMPKNAKWFFKSVADIKKGGGKERMFAT